VPALLVAGQRVGMMIDLIKRKFKIQNTVKGTKGQCHEMNIFKGLKISISTFYVCADGFQGLLTGSF
jgi:hypothetical protein